MDLLSPELKAELEKHQGKNVRELMQDGGVFKALIKGMLEHLMQKEISQELGYEKYQAKGRKTGNSRNGHNRKQVKSSFGEIELESPRDRNGDFEPKIVKKHQTDISLFDEQIISMYAKGMTVRDIQSHLQQAYCVELSATSISNMTEQVLEFARDWQNRPLASIYPVVYFDAIHYKVRDNGKIVSKAAYTALGINTEGKKDILGLWIAENEGSRFWLSICNELKNRGVTDIFIACIDGLKGLPDAILAAFPKTEIQLCIVHMVRNSLKFVSYKYEKEFIADLQKIYRAPSEEIAKSELDSFVQTWLDRYPQAVIPWLNHWDHISTFFKFPNEIRRFIYTTNTVEALHRQFRKVTKSKAVFPSDQALFKMLFLAARDISQKWSMPVRDWKSFIPQLSLFFEGRLIFDH